MRLLRTLSLLGIGAATMYLLDPRLGHRRRAMLRDRLSSRFRKGIEKAQKTGRDLSYRSRGLVHKLGDRIQAGRQVIPDHTLEARIRSNIGRHLQNHPHTFEIRVRDGHVLIEGDLSDGLYQRIQPVIRKMPGVHSVKRRAPLIRAA